MLTLKIQLKYFHHPKIQHAKFSCKIQCMKFRINIGVPKEEQSILDGKVLADDYFLSADASLCQGGPEALWG